MKFFKIIISAVLLTIPSATVLAWGGGGHAAIARIAENHLTKKAKKALNKYLDGKALYEVASDGDKFRPVWVEDLGREIANPKDFRFKNWRDRFDWTLPSNIEPYPHTFTVGDNCEPIRDLFETKDGKDYEISNCIWFLERDISELKAGFKKMDPEERAKKIKMIIHWIGDMHCPGHVTFRGENDGVSGRAYFTLKIGDRTSNLHKFWDGGIFKYGFDGKKSVTMAELADGYKVPYSKAAVKGDVWDWARSCARAAKSARIYNGQPIVKNSEIPESYALDMKDICLTQLRDGGYRLAAVLNDIFR